MKNFLQRAAAYLIDTAICYFFIIIVIQWAIVSHIREHLGMTDEWFRDSWNLEFYVILSISLPIWAYFIYLDSERGKGTFGKRIFHLQVTNLKNNPISIQKNAIRTFFKLAPWELAHIGVIFPTPMHFDSDPQLRIMTIVGLLLFIGFAASIIPSSTHQSFYDLWIQTRVGKRLTRNS